MRCSMIGLAAEVRICKKLCSDTDGRFNNNIGTSVWDFIGSAVAQW